MNNKRLRRDADNFLSNSDALIDAFVAEIEQLESDKDDMQDMIDKLSEEVSGLKYELAQLERAKQ